MFETFRSHSRILMFILLPLIAASFVFVGVEGYTRFEAGRNAKVASVAKRDITQTDWDIAHRESVEQFRRQDPQADLKFADTPEFKYQLLERLVVDRVLETAAVEAHYSTTDERLLGAYASDPRFASVRNPDGTINRQLLETALAQQRRTLAGYEQSLRSELSVRQVVLGISGTVFAPEVSATHAMDSMLQQREVQIERFTPNSYAGQVTPGAEAIEAYYHDPAHAAQFKSIERVDIEYVLLDLDAIRQEISVSEDELRKYYAANEKRFTRPEQRRASQILVKVSSSATQAERAAAELKAKALLDDLNKDPSGFAKVPEAGPEGSLLIERRSNADLFIARGDTVEPGFEEALFALKPGELSAVVRTEEGFNVLRLDEVRAGETRSFESLREEIKEQVSQQLAHQRFVQASQKFTDLVDEQSDSLKPVADRFKLNILSAQGVARVADAQARAPLSSPKFIEALFGAEVLNNKQNSDAVPLSATQIVSGRVLKHTPSSLRPLSEVREQVQARVIANQALALARAEGEKRFATLKAAPTTVLEGAAQIVSRVQRRDLPKEVLEAVLAAPASQLPAVLGMDLGERGYVVLKLNKVLSERDPVAADMKLAKAPYVRAWAEAEEKAYVDALKTRFKARIAVPAPISESGEGAVDSALLR